MSAMNLENIKRDYLLPQSLQAKSSTFYLSEADILPTIRANKSHRIFPFCVVKINNAIGVVGLLDLRYSNQLLPHETCITSKITNLKNSLLETKKQKNPIILAHNNHYLINTYLKNISEKFSANYVLEKQGIFIEIWKNNPYMPQLASVYNSLTYLHIVDGHHRVKAFDQNTGYLMYYLLASDQVITKPIIRSYFLNCDQVKEIFNQASKKFFLKRIHEDEYKSFKYKHFINLRYFDQFYIIKATSNELDIRNTLQFFYEKGKTPALLHSFSNIKLEESQSREDFGNSLFQLIIPAFPFSLVPNVSHLSPLPPHSTWFEPKIPDNVFVYTF
ncbi:MAG: hypothetical protein J0H12_03670 [Candidatus Paracaedimonas acanthamoebae]|uniref:DUF1015 family protein n=1 Tax=Candidatus Paracaedimonas acanthamoebae TaxID=244581 RepID=A0A8J7PSP0_9PROT|nr:hypothetical protein [Candidatus Paracaedimonas acanthamoebae]